MSSLHERKEKVCLNCNAAIYGRFCHVCGQENINPHESFWHLTTHFFADIFHYDGKFFSTLKYLLFKPGFLAKEHLRGKRASYLHPIRLYVFVSAIFFLITFSLNHSSESKHRKKKTYQQALKILQDSKGEVSKTNEYWGGAFKIKNNAVDSTVNMDSVNKLYDSAIAILKVDTTAVNKALAIVDIPTDDELQYSKYSSKEEYLEEQNKLAISKRDGFITRKIRFAEISIMNKAKAENVSPATMIWQLMLHNIPKILFVSLPLLALMISLFYLRHKQFNFVNHMLITIYIACFIFIVLLFDFLIDKTFSHTSLSGISTFFGWFSTLWIIYYIYKTFRVFYGQSRRKTIAKLVIFTLPFTLILFLFFIILLLATAFTV